MSQALHAIFTLLLCYLLGSLLFALIISECAYGIDIRRYGSGNCGFTNMKRTLGWKPALAVLALDMGKGAAAVGLGHWVFSSRDFGQWRDTLVVLSGILAIIGHNWSAFFQFAGGKGVATSLGVLFALDWKVGLLALAVGFPLLLYPGYMSLASMVGAISVPFWFWLMKDPLPYLVFGAIATAFVLIRHRTNIDRLRKGTEPKFSFRGNTGPPGPSEVSQEKTE